MCKSRVKTYHTKTQSDEVKKMQTWRAETRIVTLLNHCVLLQNMIQNTNIFLANNPFNVEKLYRRNALRISSNLISLMETQPDCFIPVWAVHILQTGQCYWAKEHVKMKKLDI